MVSELFRFYKSMVLDCGTRIASLISSYYQCLLCILVVFKISEISRKTGSWSNYVCVYFHRLISKTNLWNGVIHFFPSDLSFSTFRPWREVNVFVQWGEVAIATACCGRIENGWFLYQQELKF